VTKKGKQKYMINISLENKKELMHDAQLRHDLLRDEWVIIADKRGKRPVEFADQSEHQQYDSAHDVFLHPEESGQEEDCLMYKDEKGEWTTRVFSNKFPAVEDMEKQKDLSDGPYKSMVACGIHEVVVTRDGRRSFALLEKHELAEVIDAYRERYLAIMNQRGISSISIFHNHGKKAGASVVHPHSQIIAIPVVTPAVMREINACEKYAKAHKEHLFEVIVEYELERGVRIVYTNDKFIVYCPFASSRAFQMRIVPREVQPYFERITAEEELFLADALLQALKALHFGLNDPDFNYYIHTAPCDGRTYEEYSYYIDIMPRTHVYGGFEYATDIEIVPMMPEKAAEFLREVVEQQGEHNS
jgi:UDPglucose--hexose-1-phosphate uridylyltransferase